MSMEPCDYEKEAAYDALYHELGPQWARDHDSELYRLHYDEAVAEFTTDRLQAYYLKHPEMASAAVGMLDQARCLSSTHPHAALLFAVSAAEITIKGLLVRPIVNGLVHNDAVADVVMALTPGRTGSDGFKDLLFGILNKVADLDLATYKRPESYRTLWDEWKQLQNERNYLIHDGVMPSTEALGIFEAVATEFLKVVFPKVLTILGLKVSDKFTIMADAY